MPRLFVAITIPEEVASSLERLCVGLPDVRWTDPDDFHLTLRFIGEVDPPTFHDIGTALAEVSARPFEVTLRGIGHFPPRGEPTTLWVGADGGEPLAALRRRVDRALADVGVGPEPRRFQPHVTLARFRRPPPENRLGAFLRNSSLYRSASFPVSGFSLWSSVLRPEGALHALEAEYDFVSGTMERV
jgi:2'-5' RNA ligase